MERGKCGIIEVFKLPLSYHEYDSTFVLTKLYLLTPALKPKSHYLSWSKINYIVLSTYARILIKKYMT